MTKALTITPGTASGLSWDGSPLAVWGVRVASGAASDAWADALVGQLGVYRRHGVNAITVCYQGSSGGHVQGFAADGRTVEPATAKRMARLAGACRDRDMLLVAILFYQRERLGSRDAYLRAAEAAGRQLAAFENVIVNVVNEHNAGSWAGCPFPVRTADGVAALCATVRAAAPDLLVGGGGIHPGVNAALALRPELDLLLFDWHGGSAEAVRAYRAAGATKPLMNVELFGGWAQGFCEEAAGPLTGQDVTWPGWGPEAPPEAPPGRRRVQGVLPEETVGTHRGRQDFLREVSYAAATPGFSLFGHIPGWFQGPSRQPGFANRFDPGGDGTRTSPGVRWYFEAVTRAQTLW